MTAFQTITVVIGFLATLVIPTLIYLIRGAVKWTRVEDKLDHAIANLDDIVRDKNETHRVIIQQMVDDRKATDRRLRWLEENVWKGGVASG